MRPSGHVGLELAPRNIAQQILRRIRIGDAVGKLSALLTIYTKLSVQTFAGLHRTCGQTELLFKWIKRLLRLVSFDSMENAVKSQMWSCLHQEAPQY